MEGMALLQEAPHFVFYGPSRFRADVPERLCELYVLRDHPIYSLREQFLFPEMLRHRSLFHSPHYNIPLRFRGKLVVNIHDLNHLLFPENLPSALHRLYARYMFKEAAIRAAHIITSSENTRKEIMKHLRVDPARVSVLPLAISERFQPCEDKEEIEDFQRENRLPGRYLFTIGINKPHKNFPFLVQTLARLWGSNKLDIPLVIGGMKKDGRKDLESLIEECRVADKVIFVHRLPYLELPKIYAGAEALIFPSRYEGFGLPPLEAMKTGVPVIASNRPPIPEVVGDAGIYFDPTSGEELSTALERVLYDSNLRSQLIQKGRQNLGRFSWIENAKRTCEIYRRVLDKES